MSELNIIKQNGGSYIGSLQVADYIGKPHNDLMKSIRKYCDYLTEGNFSLSDFFINSTYLDCTGRELPCFLLSKMGCEMVANKLTGAKGVRFTAAYVIKFNEIEAITGGINTQPYPAPRLREFNSAVRNILTGMTYCRAIPRKVMSFLRGVYEPLGITVQTDGDDTGYYSVTEIAYMLKVYNKSGRPHGHAVSAIISKLENTKQHAIVIPYGLVGVNMRYDSNIVKAVKKWLEKNGFPSEVPHLNFFYHIYYYRRRKLSLCDKIIDLDSEN
jgi:Rha family phage regulatory protein